MPWKPTLLAFEAHHGDAYMIEINQLQAFLAINKHLSFSLAADSLAITQPAISKRIAALESRLACSLFDRIGRKVRLTQAGMTLLPRAIAILQQIQDTQREIANLSEQVCGSLSISTSHHIGLHHLPAILRQFSRQYPAVKLDLRFTDSEKAYEAAIKGDVELAVVTLPTVPDPQLITHGTWDDPLAFVVAAQHPLRTQSPILLRDLACTPAILPSGSTFTRKIVESILEQLQLSIEVGIETNYLETNRMLVSIGLGWSVLPATMINTGICAINVKRNKDDAEPITIKRQLGVVTHINRSLSNAAAAFLDTIQQNKGLNCRWHDELR